jgi:MOSC domain-containing protein YiiM
MSLARLVSVNVASIALEADWATPHGYTGIDKRAVTRRVGLEDDAVEGDVVADKKHHGGKHKAVYAYAREDALWWEEQLGFAIAPGRFGENLTTEGLDVSGALIGERWGIGTAILEVAEPRIPCRVFSGFWDRSTLVKEFTEAARPGAYLRIIKEGHVGVGDFIEILSRPLHKISVADAFRIRSGSRDRIEELKEVAELSPDWRAWVAQVTP